MNINKEFYLKESLPFFKDLSEEEKTMIYNASHIEQYKAGELIYSKYNACTGLVLVVQGELRSFMSSLSGKEITLSKLFENDLCILSSSCFYQNLSYDINLQSIDNSSIIIIDGKLFKDLFPIIVYIKLDKDNFFKFSTSCNSFLRFSSKSLSSYSFITIF